MAATFAESASEEDGDPRPAAAAYRTVCAASVSRLPAATPVDEAAGDHRLRLNAAVEALDRAFPGQADRRRAVSCPVRQTSRADGRVRSLTGLPEERPGSTGQGGG
ncbi:hypothetical protein ACE1SV_42310 [Streptomyces sennicomposti]